MFVTFKYTEIDCRALPETLDLDYKVTGERLPKLHRHGHTFQEKVVGNCYVFLLYILLCTNITIKVISNYAMKKQVIIGKSLLLGILQIIYWKDSSKSGNTLTLPCHVQSILKILRKTH